MRTIRMILLGHLLLRIVAFTDVSLCPHEQGGAGWQDVSCASAAADHETAASPSTTKELVAFPAGERYYNSAFAYKITSTMRTRLERTPSARLIAVCLAQYHGELEALRLSSVQEAALTTRTWKSHQGTIYQAVELLLETQAKDRTGRSVPYILSCPLNEDDSLDAKGMDAYLTAFRQGMPVK